MTLIFANNKFIEKLLNECAPRCTAQLVATGPNPKMEVTPRDTSNDDAHTKFGLQATNECNERSAEMSINLFNYAQN